MATSIAWFTGLLSVSLAVLVLGCWLGRRGAFPANVALLLSVALVSLAAMPKFRPALLHTILPLDISIWVEGVPAAIPWMLLVGLLWTGRATSRLRRTAPLLMVLGLVYFMYGGIWMLLPNIAINVPEFRVGNVTLQSRPDTCAPSSCSTALRMLGFYATEREMCDVILAKPGRGSSLARAAWGLHHFLQPFGFHAKLLELDADEVMEMADPDRPILVIIRSDLTADHMIVVVDRYLESVVIADPSPGVHSGVRSMSVHNLPEGLVVVNQHDFRRLYRGAAVVFMQFDAGARGRTRISSLH